MTIFPLISLGADKVKELLPPLITAIMSQNDPKLPVVWCCDPMHGNTTVTEEGFKVSKEEKKFYHLTIFFLFL